MASTQEHLHLLPSDPAVVDLNNYKQFVNVHSGAAFVIMIFYLITLHSVNIYILIEYEQNLPNSLVNLLIVISGLAIFGLIGVWYSVQWNTNYQNTTNRLFLSICMALATEPILAGVVYMGNLIYDYPTTLSCTFMQLFATVVCLYFFILFGYILFGAQRNSIDFAPGSCPEYNIKRFSWIFLNILMCVIGIENCITVILFDDYITEYKIGYIVLVAMSLVAAFKIIIGIIVSHKQRKTSHLYSCSIIIQLVCTWMLAIMYITYVVDKSKNDVDYNFYFMLLMHIVLSCLYVIVYLMSLLIKSATQDTS